MRRRVIFVERRMEPLRVEEPNPLFNHAFSLEPVLQFVQIVGLLFERPPQPFDEDIVEIATPPVQREFEVRVVIRSDPVNCNPWSIFTISGLPYSAMASF